MIPPRRIRRDAAITGDGMIRRYVVPALVVGLALSIQVSAQLLMPEPVDEAVVESARNDIETASQRLADNDIAGAARAFDKGIASPGFASLDPSVRYLGLLRAGIAALDLDENSKAHALLVRASAFDEAEGIAWHLRLRAAYALDDHADSARCIVIIARVWPQTLDQIRARAILMVDKQLGESGKSRVERAVLLAALFDANWTNEGREPNDLWFDYTRLLLDGGDKARATEVAARIDSPRVVLSLRVDKRFDALLRARKGVFDIERVMKRQREHAERIWSEAQNRLVAALGLQENLLQAREPALALALADEIIAKVAKQGSAAYVDSDEYFVWILDARSRALQRMGRWDDAVIQLNKAARRPERGAMNVSQVLNLSRLLAELEKPDEAERAVEELGEMSPYGRMQLEFTRLIVSLERDNAGAVETHLTYLREHRSDAIGTYQAALVQAERIDDAAKLLIERLQREDWLRDALEEMQEYAEVLLTPRGEIHETRWRQITARKDVLAALAKVGRIERAPFARTLL
jgi:tetratricopeptide (TPR) repeat protein